MSAKVFQFTGRTEKTGEDPHVSGEARCIACKHEWVAVIPANPEGYGGDLECPKCGCHRGQYIWPFIGAPPEKIWSCSCEGVVFMITEAGTRCIGCGRHQNFNG